ncbi:hypothetical protein [Sulfurisoma sediminicola]|uniref:Uncharacterized protein n=1 Tax=Sulfurisoma sediminicola TaxID=1381557 RepID=A0A497XDU4_9PROT|nr:hypothetical protein [Sulfurisoma sediminicola]RLJ65151.1 hypothetical protein DFR35_1807 [Sulfurisoma sediminicola]
MSDRTLRYLIAAVIAMLLVFHIGNLIAAAFGAAWGAVSAVAVAAVSLLSARLARTGGRSSFWFLLPTLLFTIVPTAIMVWRAITADTGILQRLVDLLPFLVGFVGPIALLFLVYYELRKRGRSG